MIVRKSYENDFHKIWEKMKNIVKNNTLVLVEHGFVAQTYL